MRQVTFVLLSLLASCSFCPPLAAQQRSSSAQIKAILGAKQLRGVRIGVLAVDLDSGRVIVSHNAAIARLTASNTKLVTTAAGLEQLGAGYNFSTKLYLKGQFEGELLTGDLLLVGSGDPSFSGRFYDGDSTRVLAEWVAALKKLGLRKISGDLLLDVSALSGPAVHPGWPQDQLQKWYCAPVSALNLNDNCLNVTVRPGQSGGLARYAIHPSSSYFKLINKMSTTSTGKHAPWVHLPPGSPPRLELRGRVRSGRKPQTITVAVPDPALMMGAVLHGLLARAGITLGGSVKLRSTAVPSRGRLVALHKCSIERVVMVINKRSQNLFAECLFRALGRKHGNAGSFEGGRRAVESYLSKLGIRGASVADGCGLARGNRYSPRAIVKVLRRMWKHKSRKVFFDSLSIAGKDGTLRKRMRRGAATGRVHAKTGYIRSVSALSGYVKTASGRWVAFSLLFNGFQRKGKRLSNSTIKGYQDKICQVLAASR